MKKLNPAHVSAILKQVNTCPYFDLLSMKLAALEPGRSHLEVDVQEKHLQPYGIVHGGVYASLVDAAGFWAAYTQREGSEGLTTVEMKLNYLAPAASGRFLTTGKCIKIGSRICLSEAAVKDPQGKLLAHGTVTLMVLDSLAIKGQSQLPPKFVED
ncbi:MAG: PaaI family thioesterase [Desulfatiglandaceae bacterium]